MLEFFTYNSRTDELEFNIEITIGIKPYKELWKSKRHGTYDKEYRKKEFMYIYFMANMTKKNPYYVLDTEERHIEAKKAAELPNNWEPDALIEECVNHYITETFRLTPTAKLVVELQRSVMQAADVVKVLRQRVDNSLLALQANNDIIAVTLETEALEKILAAIFNIGARIEDTNKRIESLEKILRQEEAQAAVVTGKKKKGNREDP